MEWYSKYMKRDISADKFEKMTYTAKKKYVAQLLIRESKARPVADSIAPLAVVMAGVPGAGKTEFLDSLEENANTSFVRVDLDQIVTVYPEYTPKTYAQFRSGANGILAHSIDELRRGRYNMMIDGTFSGTSEASIRNIEKLLKAKYEVVMYYMYDDAETAWNYTKLREIETERGIDLNGFIESCRNVPINLSAARAKFNEDNFELFVVKQKELRDKDYNVLTDDIEIDEIIKEGYNIDKLKEIL